MGGIKSTCFRIKIFLLKYLDKANLKSLKEKVTNISFQLYTHSHPHYFYWFKEYFSLGRRGEGEQGELGLGLTAFYEQTWGFLALISLLMQKRAAWEGTQFFFELNSSFLSMWVPTSVGHGNGQTVHRSFEGSN